MLTPVTEREILGIDRWSDDRPRPVFQKSVKTATPSDERQIIDAVVLAFSADPAVRWMYPDPHQYLSSFPEFIRGFAGKAFEHGTAYYIDGYVGAALWLPPDVHPDEAALIDILERTVFERDQEELFGVFEQMDRYHPKEPHWYLPLLGVEPAHQRKGYGSALLQHVLAVCDRDRLPAYLESSNPANVSLYQRHGFEILGTIQTETSPPLFPMLRRAR